MFQRMFLLLIVMLSATSLLAQSKKNPDDTQLIPEGSSVYIEPQDGFEVYLADALKKKKVPLSTVSNQNHADFIISPSSESKKAAGTRVRQTSSDAAKTVKAKANSRQQTASDQGESITLTHAKTGAVAFTYPVKNKNSDRGMRGAAESYANHLKKKMKDDRKKIEKAMKAAEKEKKDEKKRQQESGKG